jgi:hypothetical protein
MAANGPENFRLVLRQQLIEQNFSIWRDRRLAEASRGPDNVVRNDDDRHRREQSVDDREQLRSSQTKFNALARLVDDAIRRDERG